MAIRHASTRKFDLGPRAFQLGLTTYAFSDVLRICSPAVNRIAAQTQDHVCLIIRTGFDIVPICEVPAVVPICPMIRTYAEPAPLGSNTRRHCVAGRVSRRAGAGDREAERAAIRCCGAGSNT